MSPAFTESLKTNGRWQAWNAKREMLSFGKL